MKPVIRAILRAALVVAPATGFVSAAVAQDLPKTISPLQIESDSNGVNFATGRMAVPALTLSVPGSSRLKFDRVQNAAPYVSGKRQIALDSGDDLTAQNTVHTADGISEGFTCSWIPEAGAAGKACVSTTGTGSALIYNGTDYRRAGSGERYTLNILYMNTPPNQSGNPDQSGYSVYYASKIEYPDGEVISYTYDSASISTGIYPVIVQRPTRISSNLGYFIAITYQGTDPTQGDWYSPTEAAIFSAAAPTTALQRYTYGANGTTDIAGRVYTGFGAGALGSPIEQNSFTQTLPGEAAAAITVSATTATNAPLVGQVVRDGVAWSYSYLNPFLYSGETGDGSWHFAAITRTGPNGDLATVEIKQQALLGSYTKQNTISKFTDALGRATVYDRDGYLRVTRVTYPEGNFASIAYDAAGNVVTRTSTAKPGSSLAAISEQTFVDLTPYYNSAGILSCRETTLCYRPQWYRDGRGQQTDFVYNARGQLTEMTVPANQQGIRQKTINDYQEVDTGGGVMFSRKVTTRTCGVGTTCGVSDDTRTEFQYWGNTGLPSLVRQIASGQTRDTTYTYDIAGRVLSVDGPLAGSDDTQYFRYDVLGRRTWEIGALGPNGLRLAKRTTYRDSDDRPVAVEMGTLTSPTDPNLMVIERADTTYDSRRYPVREARSASGVTKAVADRSFLDRGLAECSTTRMNLTALPAAGNACTPGTAGSDGPDRITKNIYDAAGQLVQMREGVGTSVEAAEATYSYTANGKREYVIDANGNQARLIYDGHDRLSQWNFPSPTRPTAYNDATQASALNSAGATSATDYEAYQYDANGNRIYLRKRDGRTINYYYDALNRQIQKGGSYSADISYSYDLRGLQLTATFITGGEGITNAYNGFGELTSTTSTMGGTSRTLSYQYDGDSNRTRITHPDGVFFTTSYDALNRTSGANWTIGASTTPFMGITYDSAGRRSGMTRGSSATGYFYDGISRLGAMSQYFAGGAGNATSSYGYNPASQMVSETRDNDAYAWTGSVALTRPYTANGLNQYTAAGPATFTYDANGNLTSDGSSTFTYDVENRLVSASGAKTASLTYDPLGRLWRVTGPTTDTRFLYDGDKLALEYDAAGSVAWRYYFGPNVDEPILADQGGRLDCNNTRFLHLNHQGSMVAAADCYGNRTTVATYDEYGIPGPNNWGRFQYTGQAWLPELGMYYYKARIYSPTLGRFLQTDPIGYDDQINLYAYVGNDPVNKGDPTGLYECAQKDCATIEKARNEIVQARNNIQYKTGSRIPTAEGKMLTSVLGVLGTKQDNNGLTITLSANGGNPGSFFGPTNTITLDTLGTRQYGRNLSLAGVLTHEGSHARDFQLGLNAGKFGNEIKANAFQAIFEIGSGRPGEFYRPGMKGTELVKSLKNSGMAYCGAGGPATADCQRSINEFRPDIPIP